MLREHQVADLIGRIYDAALDASRWPSVLDDLARLFHGNTACLFRQDLNTGAARALGLHHLDLQTFAEYEAYYWTKDIWSLNPARHAPGRAYASHQHIADDILLRSEIYNDFLKARQMFYAIGGLPLVEGSRMYMVGVHRPRRGRRRYEPRDLRMLQPILPHLKRALQIHHRLEAASVERDALADTADRLPRGVLTFNAQGGLLWMNRAAEAICGQRDGFTVQRGLVTAAVHAETRRLDRLVRAAGRTAEDGPACGDAMLITRPSGRRPYIVLVSPLQAGRGMDDRQPAGIMFVSDPDRMPELPPMRLSRLYGLTPAEARLAQQLAAGRELRDIAAASQRTMNTVRTQLKQVFHKTGTTRQAQLVRLVLEAEEMPRRAARLE